MTKRISFRTIIQILIFAFVVYLGLAHLFGGIEKAASIDAYCPFGAVESVLTLIFKGEFLKRIFTSSFILMGIFIVGTLILGRVFCGYLCPLGALQEWTRALGRKIGFKKDLEIKGQFDKYLRLVKYLVLAIIVYFSFYLNDLIFRNYDPYSSLMHFGSEFTEKIAGYIVLFVLVILALFAKSWWCRYLCPLGAFFGLIKKISFFKIKRDKKTCIDCSACDRTCPAHLKIMSVDTIKDADCISCGACVGDCPKESLSYSLFSRKVSKRTYSILVALIVLLPLFVMPFTPIWKTKAESNIVNIKGAVNVADIRGSNTLEYVIKTTGVPFSVFQKEFNLPANFDQKIMLKEIGVKYNLKNKLGDRLETEDFRALIQAYFSFQEKLKSECPFGEVNCEFPGECGNYIDRDGNDVCDYSE